MREHGSTIVTAPQGAPSEPSVEVAASVLFDTLPDRGLDTMTPQGVEFVLCASALTAQM